MLIGIDVSSSIIGIAILDSGGSLISNLSWDLRKLGTMYDKAAHIANEVISLRKYAPTSVYIEEALMNFRFGSTSANTLSVLHKFNGIVSWLIYEKLGIEPKHINPTTARSLVGIKVPKGSKAKEVVLEHLSRTEPVFTVEYTKFGNPRAEFYDMADAIVVARAGYIFDSRGKTT